MWQELKTRPRPKRQLPAYASINRRGEIVLNPTVYAYLKGLYYVSLHYDERTRQLAITRPARNGGRVYNVRRFGRKGRLRVIRATRFLKHFGIEVTGTCVFTDIRYYPDPDTVILNLRNVVTRAPSTSEATGHKKGGFRRLEILHEKLVP